MWQFIISGVAAGSIYAMLALGIVLINKSTGAMNFAMGNVALFGAFLIYSCTALLNLPTIIGLPLGIFATIILATIINRVAIRPVMGSTSFSIVIMTLGVGIILDNIIGLTWGYEIRKQEISIFSGDPIQIGNLIIARDSFITIIVGIIFAIGVYILFNHTKVGYSMTAVAQDRTLALYYGVSTKKSFAITWGMVGLLAACAGLLLTSSTYLSLGVQSNYQNKAMASAVIGGLASVPGAFAGGLILGIAENLVCAYVSVEWKEVISSVITFIVLCFLPQGIFGKQNQRRV